MTLPMGPGVFIFFQTLEPVVKKVGKGFAEYPDNTRRKTRIIQDDNEILDFLMKFVTDKL